MDLLKTIALVLSFALRFDGGIGQGLNALDKTKRSELYEFDSLTWCRSVVNNVPVEIVSERDLYSTDPVYLWVRIKVSENSSHSAGTRSAPAFIKLFRVTSYGLAPEMTPTEVYSPPREEGRKFIKSPPNAAAQMKKRLFESDEFKTSLWTGPINFLAHGSYFVKLIDIEGSTIPIKNKPFVRFEVKTRKGKKN
jgi:hypothetical protein